MPETLVTRRGDREKWIRPNVMKDLKEQAGLDIVSLKRVLMWPYGYRGRTSSGTKFIFFWAYDAFFTLNMEKDDNVLVEAFAKVLGYRPICKYTVDDPARPLEPLVTYEWDKQDPAGLIVELERDNAQNLQKLE